ncbi:hypothetical protein [Latilactobacillus fuchuensis]|uniref:hypothetical protein n=1 Tax=Latilactobacillus fuchuensis TaxID=164393 RepID=UPI000687124D|nr:hypothetical protein [Latilactobacillus fuchuensis]
MNVISYDNWVTRCNPLTKLTMIPCFGIATAIFPDVWLGLVLLFIILVLAAVAHLLSSMIKMMGAFGVLYH